MISFVLRLWCNSFSLVIPCDDHRHLYQYLHNFGTSFVGFSPQVNLMFSCTFHSVLTYCPKEHFGAKKIACVIDEQFNQLPKV